jgi:glycosyltransferase involved in cell wall biosynthesis
MKILYINNFLTRKGGAEISLLNTGKLLAKKSHKIFYFTSENIVYKKYFVIQDVVNLIYSFKAKKKIGNLLDKIKPDVIHLNNIYHHLSPSIIDEIKLRKIPMVMTLRDYKLVCAIYKLWREGKICEECRNKNYNSIIKNRCRLKNHFGEEYLLWLEMNLHHKLLHIYYKVDTFISPSQFLINKFKEMGWKRKIEYLPNFVFDDDYSSSKARSLISTSSRYARTVNTIVYFGRLAPEKGLNVLLAAFKQAQDNLSIIHPPAGGPLSINLKIIGDGPMKEDLKFKIQDLGLKNVQLLGWLEGEKLKKEIQDSLFTILPSTWYENCPRSILESFALGKSVVASNVGGIPEMVRDKSNGLLVKPGSVEDLSHKILWLINHPKEILKMGKIGQEIVKKKYNEENYYGELMRIYEKTIKNYF